MAYERVLLLILAGGRSARFGIDKGLFEYEGEQLVKRIARVLGSRADEITVGVASGMTEAYRAVLSGAVEIVEDEESHRGPLYGLRDAVRYADEEIIWLVPCDMPFLTPDLFILLQDRMGECDDASVPVVNGYLEPIMAVYRRKPLRDAVAREITLGDRKLSGILRHLRVRELPEEALRRSDFYHADYLLNLNRPPD